MRLVIIIAFLELLSKLTMSAKISMDKVVMVLHYTQVHCFLCQLLIGVKMLLF